MSGTVRAISYLLGTSFATGQQGGIGADDLRDLTSTVGTRGTSVTDYGAIGDDFTDCTTAINNALAAMRTGKINNYAPSSNNLQRLIFPPGSYVVTGPLNFTGFTQTNLIIEGWGAYIHGKVSSGAIVDMMGSRGLVWNGLVIYGDPSNAADYGILMGRQGTIDGGTSTEHTFNQIRVTGKFAQACVYNFACEVCCWINPYFFNTSTASTAYAIIMDGNNHFSVASTFVSQTLAANTAQSFNENTFVGGWIMNTSTTVGPIYMGAAHRHAYVGSYAAATGGATWAVRLDLSVNSSPIMQLHFDCHLETTALASSFLITGSTGRIAGIRYTEHDCQASTQVFKRDTGVVTVNIEDLDVQITFCSNGSPTLFDSASAFNAYGDLSLANPGMFTAPVGFAGRVRAGSDFGESRTTAYYAGTMFFPDGLTNAANDGAAATAGVAVGQAYRNGSVLMVRVT